MGKDNKYSPELMKKQTFKLVDEGLSTLFCKVESILNFVERNSRRITYVRGDVG